MVELRTRINCDLMVYKPRTLMSEVLTLVSLPGLKKRAAMPPKPQFVSRERTTKGKASRFLLAAAFAAAALSLCGISGSFGILGILMVKGTGSPLRGMVSVLICCQANVCTESANSNNVNKPVLIIEYIEWCLSGSDNSKSHPLVRLAPKGRS